MKILGGNIMEYKAVIENKRGDKYVLKDDVLKNSKLSKESLDKLETYNILSYVDDDYDCIINIECYLLSDVKKLENENKLKGGNIMKYIMKYRKRGSHEVWETYISDNRKDFIDFLKTKKCDYEFEIYGLSEKGYIGGIYVGNPTVVSLKITENNEKIDNKVHLDDDDVEIWDDEFEDEDMEMSPEELEDNDDDVEIWDDEFEDEDMEMSPEELEDNDEYETKLEYLYRKYDCNDMETLQYRCPIDIKAYKQFMCLNSEATDEFKRSIDEREEKENEAIMKIVEERNKKERNIRYTSDDTETIFKSFFTI